MSAHVDAGEELSGLLDDLYRQQHCDFRGYSRASIERNVARACATIGVPNVAALRARIASDAAALRELLHALTTQVSDLFRDADYFRALRERVVPHLATYPSIRVWVAGCGTGEEALSIAILLREAGVLERSLIYATDIDERSLHKAMTASYARERLTSFSDSYRRAGGCGELSDHCRVDGASVTFDGALRERMLFSEHSLATDSAFAEVQLVSCRNVLIYFAPQLRDRAVGLFLDSLCTRGFLGLGATETLAPSTHAARFESFATVERLYRRAP